MRRYSCRHLSFRSFMIHLVIGVSSLQALLARERDENQPELNMLLTEAAVAVYTSLLIHSLTTYDPNLLYRLVANPFVERLWPALFGGGVKKLVRLNRHSDAKASEFSHSVWGFAKRKIQKIRVYYGSGFGWVGGWVGGWVPVCRNFFWNIIPK